MSIKEKHDIIVAGRKVETHLPMVRTASTCLAMPRLQNQLTCSTSSGSAYATWHPNRHSGLLH